MANIRTQWDQIRTIMDGFNAQIDRYDDEKKAVESKIEALCDEIVEIEKRKSEVERQMAAEAARISKGFVGGEAGPPVTPAITESEVSAADKPEVDPEQAATDAAFEAMNKRVSESVKRSQSPSELGDDEPTYATPAASSSRGGPEKKRRTRAPNKVDNSACIHPDLPTVVPSGDGGWVELRCDICGSNWVTKHKKFLQGALGMAMHYSHVHQDALQPGESYKLASILNRATYHVLTAEEYGGILAGDPSAYVVEAVGGGVKNKTAKLKTKDGEY